MKNMSELNSTILLLEKKQAVEGALLREQIKMTYESLKPVNIIMNTLEELVATPNFKDDLVNTSISLAAGYFSKKLAIGSSNNLLKQLLGGILQISVTNLVSRKSDNIRSKFMEILNVIFEKKT